MKQYLAGIAVLMLSQAFAITSTPWQQIARPIAGAAQAIGSFSNGCIIGARPLPPESSHYQIMRPDQRRYFGHPELLAFIHRLGEKIQPSGTLLVGDMAMPAGGRFSYGHTSHQSGLDVDIWLQLPAIRWSREQLLTPKPLDLVTANGREVVPQLWQSQITDLIKLAAKDGKVARIFVSPAIKKQLCHDAGAYRDWLRKIRPWFGHRAHMHVRLHCPASSPECLDQAQPPPGDGCGAELESWFLTPQPGKKPESTEPVLLPAACQALLDNQRAMK